MQVWKKRLNGASGKKRRLSEPPGASSKTGANAKNGSSKGSRKISTSSQPVAPEEVPEKKVEEVLEVEDKPCARNSPEQCPKNSRPDSKYCSDECGMIVARTRIDEMVKSGFDVAAFIRSNATKSFVHARGI